MDPSTDEEPDNRTVRTLQKEVEELRRQVDVLKLEYRRAASDLPGKVAADLASIKEAREEATRIATFLQGTELFGRYAQDANRHSRIADRWRITAVAILIIASIGAVAISKYLSLSETALVTTLTPALGLFVYASLESHNHRRREFDRRRIALRVSAIEAYTKQRRETGNSDEKREAESLLGEFIRKHFINPELDSNDMAYPTFSFVTVTERRRDGNTDTPAHPASDARTSA
ncbi:hypothetical protein ACFPIJ_36445 [Dactylosporangium cerinum]|uniref:SLATT domain-containing protein n=1 Tax=Dactylosporangium cerinum TaxID=1434730 RepID=A0ABV9W5X2_9ACTN